MKYDTPRYPPPRLASSTPTPPLALPLLGPLPSTPWQLFPGWLITLLLVIMLGLTSHRTFVKGLTLWKKEVKRAFLV